MLLHHRDEHVFGQRQIFLLEVAQQRGGLLDEIGYFFQQAGIVGNLPVSTSRPLWLICAFTTSRRSS